MNTYFRRANLTNHALTMESLVKHLVFEAEGVDISLIRHDQLVAFAQRLCGELQLHIVRRFDHQFSPYGSTVVFVLEESHIAIHSWPEHGYIHCDVVTCTSEPVPVARLQAIVSRDLAPQRLRFLSFKY